MTLLQGPVSRYKSLKARLGKAVGTFCVDGYPFNPEADQWILEKISQKIADHKNPSMSWRMIQDGPSILPESLTQKFPGLVINGTPPYDALFYSGMGASFECVEIQLIHGVPHEVLISTSIDPSVVVLDTRVLPPRVLNAHEFAQQANLESLNPTTLCRLISVLWETETVVPLDKSELAPMDKQVIQAFIDSQPAKEGRFRIPLCLDTSFQSYEKQLSSEAQVVLYDPTWEGVSIEYVEWMAQKYFKSVEVLSFPTPPLADRVETRVEAAFREGQYEHALQVANQLVTPYAEVAVSVLNFLGASYVQMGDSLRGEICFNHIFKACPEYWRAYINYGTLCIAQKKYAQALHAFEKGFQLSPPVLWETLLTLTLLYIQTQQTELAKQCLAWIRVTHEQYPMLVPQSIVDKANMFWNHYGVHA